MAAAAAVAAVSDRTIPAAISDRAAPPAQRRAARWREPAPATPTWTTIFRSEPRHCERVGWTKRSVARTRDRRGAHQFDFASRDGMVGTAQERLCPPYGLSLSICKNSWKKP